MAERIDLMKAHRADYAATGEAALVDIGPAWYLVIEGMGAPGGESFRERLSALYAVAYAVRKRVRVTTGIDYAVPKLEAQWWGVKGPGDFFAEPKEDWNWRLMLRTVEEAAEKPVESVITELRSGGKNPLVGKVRLEQIREGRCIQVLHKGTYDGESESVGKMNDLAGKLGLSFHGLHHEIYLSDPRKTPPEERRTILRMPVI